VDKRISRDMISVIRTEKERRNSILKGLDQNIEYDQWLFTDAPFICELCLMFLVTLRNQIERELVGLAARADAGANEISGREYKEKVTQLRKTNSRGESIGWNWDEIDRRLKFKSCDKYKFIEALRLLSNLYKHDTSMMPDEKLLKLLQLPTGVNYASLSESDALQEGFANFLGLGNDADYCDIADRFVDLASDFLAIVKSQTTLCEVKWGAVSLNPNDFAR
jgi:hypothetical protein